MRDTILTISDKLNEQDYQPSSVVYSDSRYGKVMTIIRDITSSPRVEFHAIAYVPHPSFRAEVLSNHPTLAEALHAIGLPD